MGSVTHARTQKADDRRAAQPDHGATVDLRLGNFAGVFQQAVTNSRDSVDHHFTRSAPAQRFAQPHYKAIEAIVAD